MDFWNKQKVIDLELKLKQKDLDIEHLKNENEILRKKISGERVCGRICSKCEHGIKICGYTVGNIYIQDTYECELDIKCKDFKRKD